MSKGASKRGGPLAEADKLNHGTIYIQGDVALIEMLRAIAKLRVERWTPAKNIKIGKASENSFTYVCFVCALHLTLNGPNTTLPMPMVRSEQQCTTMFL